MRSSLLSLILSVCLVIASESQTVIANNLRDAQRAFLMLAIREKGVLLMVADKSKKGVHYQLPGGRLDSGDFTAMNVTTDKTKLTEEDLVKVGIYAIMREVREETGYVLKHPEEIEFLRAITDQVAREHKKHRGFVKGTKLPRKLFFKADVDYEDFVENAIVLSEEHIGYVLEPRVHKISKLLKYHSGGDPSRAVALMHQRLIEE